MEILLREENQPEKLWKLKLVITYKDSVQVAPLPAIYYKNTGKLLRKYRWITPQIIVNFALVAEIPDVHVTSFHTNSESYG